MNIFIKIILVLLCSISLHASDGEHHNHEGHSEEEHAKEGHVCRYDDLKNEVAREHIEEVAKQKVEKLVEQKKISKSWKAQAVAKIGKTHYGDTNDWVVVFENQKIKKKSKQTLYVFVSTRGKVMGVNYTGK